MQEVVSVTTQMDSKQAEKLKLELGRAVNDFKRSGFKIGVILKTIKESKAYAYLGYESLEAFASTEFHIEKSQAYNMIKIVEEFGVRDKNENLVIAEKFSEYQDTKLLEIAKVEKEKRLSLDINPGMSVREIREIVKAELNGGSNRLKKTAKDKKALGGMPVTGNSVDEILSKIKELIGEGKSSFTIQLMEEREVDDDE